MSPTDQKGPIAVYGATGFTGKLVAAELDRRGAEMVLAGRSAGKLASLAAELRSQPRTIVAGVDDSPALNAALEDAATVIACAGPFGLHGEPVVKAAVETATNYLDTTGEQPFIRKVIEHYGPRAERAGCALVSAFGFDYVPGDMIAALTAKGMGPLDELTLAYSVRGLRTTRGTMLSSLEMMAGGDVEYRDGQLRAASTEVDRGSWEFPEPIGRQRMMRYPAGEQITVPMHLDTANVRTLLSAGAVMPPRLAALAPLALGSTRLALKTPLKKLMVGAINRLPEGPDETHRRAAGFTIQCVARAGNRTRTATVTGSDVYGLTAAIIAHGALLASAPEYAAKGGLAPSQAFDPAGFLDEMAPHGVEYSVDPPPPG